MTWELAAWLVLISFGLLLITVAVTYASRRKYPRPPADLDEWRARRAAERADDAEE